MPEVSVPELAAQAKKESRPKLPALPVWGPSTDSVLPPEEAGKSPLRLNSFARSELVAQVGMTDNNLTLWIRHGLIRPHGERSGRGNALRYPFYEANIAALLLHLHRFDASIETMKGIAGIYRAALSWGLSFGLTPDIMVIITSLLHEPIWAHAKIKKDTGKFDPKAFSQAVHKHEAKFGLSSHRPTSRKAARTAKAQATKDDRLVSPVLIEFVERVDFDEWKLHASAFYDLLLQPRALTLPCPVFFWKTADGWRRGESTEGQLVASERDGAYVTIAIDTLGVFYHLWNKGDGVAHRDISWGDIAP